MGHLDHVGVNTAKAGDQIFNGAMDNAAGIAAMLEVARALAESPKKPRRSILFAAVTGEEQGLLGSAYLARFARINYLIAREIADQAERPRWYLDSFFGNTFAEGQPKAAR